MKKTFKLIAVLFIGTMLFTSCEQENPEPTIETGLEGQFMPERKISSIEIFNLDSNDSLSLSINNVYEWDGDLLRTFSQLLNGLLSSKQTFYYDSLYRVSKIVEESETNSTSYNFVYNEKLLDKVFHYDNEELIEEYSFVRTDGKMTQITHNNYDPQETTIQSLIWEGENVIQSNMDSNGNIVPTYYTYDDKVSPLKGLYNAQFYYSPSEIYSENNSLTQIMEIQAGGLNFTTTITNEFEYDDKGYPVKATSVRGTGPITNTTIVHYTYLD